MTDPLFRREQRENQTGEVGEGGKHVHHSLNDHLQRARPHPRHAGILFRIPLSLVPVQLCKVRRICKPPRTQQPVIVVRLAFFLPLAGRDHDDLGTWREGGRGVVEPARAARGLFATPSSNAFAVVIIIPETGAAAGFGGGSLGKLALVFAHVGADPGDVGEEGVGRGAVDDWGGVGWGGLWV
jgi:hypothetical protein